MKKVITVFAAVVMIAAFTTRVTAQESATKTQDAGAKIVATLTIASDIPLNFGTMSIPDVDVAVELTTANIRNPVPSTHIALMDQASVTNALYVIRGEANYTYSIILPLNGTVKIVHNTTDIMDIDGFKALITSKGSEGTNGTLVLGVDEFKVGATLKVKGAQPSGIYHGTFDVTVKYD